MTDISKCNYKECDKKGTCLRFMENVEEYQEYLVNFDKICGIGSNYEYFIQNDTQPTEQK